MNIDTMKTEILPWLPILVALVSGIFLLAGYVIQKTLEYRRTVVDKRLETYSMFLKHTFVGLKPMRSKHDLDRSEEIFWKAQVSLYGSDEVIQKLGEFTTLLPRGDKSSPDHASDIPQMTVAFDKLMLAMRRDITPRSRATALDLRKISPILTE